MTSNSMRPVLQDNFVPYYYQIREIIRHRIIDGQYAPGAKIPSEAELQEYFGVSRGTIRKAIDSLVATGMLRREQGMGTFVSEPRISELLSRLVSFSEEMRLKGKVPSTSHMHVSQVVPPELVANALEIKPDEPVLRIERVRCADGKPVVILTSWLPKRLGVQSDDDFSGSLIELLETKYAVDLHLGDQVIEAARADEQQAKFLEIEEGDPVLTIRRTSYSKAGVPVEYVEGAYRADRYSYRIQMHRNEMLR